MLSNLTRILVAAAFLAGAPLITATINNGALAAEPEVGVIIVSPSPQVYTNSPVNLVLIRIEKWNSTLASNSGQMPCADSYCYHVDVYIQRREGGVWKQVYRFFKPFYSLTPQDKLQVNLWSKSDYGGTPMKDMAGLQNYRVRAQSYFKLGNTYNWTKFTNWTNFSVHAQPMVTPQKAVGTIPKVGPTPPTIGKLPAKLPAKQLKPAPKAPGPAPVVKRTAPAVKKAAPVVKRAAPAVKKAAPAVKKAAPAVTQAAPVVKRAAPTVKKTAPARIIAPAKPRTIDVPTLKLVPRE